MGQVIKRVLTRLDFFSTIPSFRAQGSGKQASVALGVFSFIFYGLFGTILITNLVNLFIKDSSQINSSSSFEINLGIRKFDNFLLGLKFQKSLNVTNIEYQKYFNIYFDYSNYNSTSKLPEWDAMYFKPCQLQQWKLLGQDYKKIFDQNHLSQYLCLIQPIKFSGNDEIQPIIRLHISSCDNHQYCKTKQEINFYYDSIFKKYSYFPIYISFLTTYAQMSDKQPLKYRVQQKMFSTYKEYGTQVFLTINPLTIQIDSSVWPIINQTSNFSGFAFGQTFYARNKLEEFPFSYFTLYLLPTKNTQVFSQTYKKIDSILSYVGGLMGVFGVILTFLLKSYNQYRYELFVAENSFNYDTDGHKITQNSFNFWNYIKFRVFFWYYLFTNRFLNSKQNIQTYYTILQGKNLLDVSYFFRRIQILERSVWKTNDRNMLLVKALNQFKSIQQIQKKCITLQYYHEIIKLKNAATVEDALEQSTRSFQYLQKIKKGLESQKAKKSDDSVNIINQYDRQLDENITNIENIQQKQRVIKQSLMKHLKLQNYPEVCQKISLYSVIADDANAVEMDEQFEQVEKQITNSFINLKPEDKFNFMQKIPLKIIHRMRLRAIQMQKQATKNQSKNKPGQLKKQFQKKQV